MFDNRCLIYDKIYVCTNKLYVNGFAKRGLIHASDFAILMRHNFICSLAMRLKFTIIMHSVMIGKSLYKILELQIKLRASYASLKLKNWKRV